MKVICMWSKGSSNKETGINQLPDKCKAKNCKGIFDSHKELIEFCEIGQPIVNHESVKRFVQRYDLVREIEVKEE